VTLTNATLTITKAPLTITADGQTKIYGADNPTLTGTITGIKNGDGITASYSTVATASSGVDSYAIVPAAVDASPAKLANYAVTLVDGSLVVGKAALTVTADDKTRVYGDANPGLTVSYAGFVLGQSASVLGGTLTVSTSATPASVVGSYAITAAGQTSSNYTISYVAGTLRVTKAALSVTAANQMKVYGTANPTLTGLVSGIKNGDAITASYATTADASSSVGSYVITATLADPGSRLGNYTVTNTSGTLSVTPAGLVVTPASAARTYGDANPVFTGLVSGVVNGDGITATYDTAADASSPVGPYDITATLVDLNSRLGNYAVTLNTGTLSIDPAALTVTVDSKNKAYGDANPDLTGTLTGVKNTDGITVSYSTAATLLSAVGSYPITAVLADPGSKLGNYTVTNTAGVLVVSAAELVVTANNASRTYGAANPTLDGALTGIRNNDPITATYATDAVGSSPVGPYLIIPTLHGDVSNYTVQVTHGTLSVTKAALSVTPANKTKVYGTANPALTGSINGIQNGDAITATYATTADASSVVGNYNITATLVDLGAKLGNYDVTYNTGVLSITAAALIVTPANANRTYGDANPVFTGVVSGVVNGDGITATYATAATPGTAVGPYAITAALVDPNAKAGNYTVTLTNATLTITKAPLTITADGQTKIYGADNPTLTGTITGIKNGDGITASYSTVATASSGVDSYAIVPAAVDASPAKLANYAVTLVDGSLVVGKAALTVTADDKTRVYGDANPGLTVSYAGFVLGQSASVLGGTLTVSTSATPASVVGSYAITAAGQTSSNYTISYVAGTLRVTKAALSVTAANQMKVYGTANPALTGTVVGVRNGDAITASYDTTADASSPVGDYVITATLADPDSKLGNYMVTLTNATLTITKAPLTITADNKTAQYSDPSPTLTKRITGFVPGQDESVLSGTLSLGTTRTVSSPAGPYLITAAGLTSANYAITYVPGTFTVNLEDASVVYTGDSLVSTGSTSTSSTKTVQLSAAVAEASDGNLGTTLGAQSVIFTVFDINGAQKQTCTSRVTVPTAYNGNGTATCSVTLGEGNYVVDVALVTNGYYVAPHDNGAVTVVLAGTGFTTGGGWLKEPTLGTKSNLGFTVKYLKNGNVQGNSLYIYRKTLAVNQVANPSGGYLPAGDYNWIIKSNVMTGLTQKCPTGTLIGCTATFAGKSTITAANRATGVQYSLGGNNQFQVDVRDNGEPGSSSSTTPDTYALRVWDASGTTYQLGTPTAQIALNGGNIQVRP